MGNRYGTSLLAQIDSRPLSSGWMDRVRHVVVSRRSAAPPASSDLQLCRLIGLMVVALLLTFGAVYKVADSTGANSFWPELSLAFVQLLVLGASYRSRFLQERLVLILGAFFYLTAAWFIFLAVVNGFNSNYAVGLLFIIPGLGVGYGIASRHILPLGFFFFLSVGSASLACFLAGGPGVPLLLFVASLVCISLVTMFVAAGWLGAQKRWLASEERYRAVVEQASDGIYLLDAQTNRLLDANQAFCRMVGMSVSELRETRIDDLIVPGSELPTEHLSLIASRRPLGSERMLRRADGELVFVELKADRISSEEGEIVSVVVHDIQSRKEYEERLLKAKESAEEIAKFKSSLLANMSHEIRTPLCSILGWTSVLSDELPDGQRELVRLIEQSGKRLHHTLDAVIELAHLQANAKKVRPTVVDLNEEVAAAVAPFDDQANTKGLTLTVERAAGEVWAELDPGCLRRIIGHIVENAIKFSDDGRISVTVGEVRGEPSIVVADTGAGISEDFLPSIFDEFKQESAGLSRDHEGNGLGLAIARRLTELIDGRIEVVSERGVGSTFTVYVRAARVAARKSA